MAVSLPIRNFNFKKTKQPLPISRDERPKRRHVVLLRGSSTIAWQLYRVATPGAGARTYTLYLRRTGDSNDVTFIRGGILIQEVRG